MNIIKPKPFTFEAGRRAVLLLHGFTGHSADVRMLGRFLEKKNYTSHAPIYRGHGLPPEELLTVGPDDWWEDILDAYEHLLDLGYDEIAVAGLSMGGVLGLKLAYLEKVKAVIPICTPMFFDNERQLTKGFRAFAKEYKQLQRKDEATVEKELEEMMDQSPPMFERLKNFVEEVNGYVPSITVPTFIAQARHDQMINPESATFIYENIQGDPKELVWYEESGHVLTLDKERDKLHEDVYTFLESLDWEE